jgi:biopolymer transport protein ExbD
MFEEERRKPLKLSMTPLIDMVFLLLVFFMLTTSFSVKEGIELNYGGQDGRVAAPRVPKAFVLVSIEPEGVVMVNEKVSSLSEFSGDIETLLIAQVNQRVFVQTIGEPSVQELVSVVDQLNLLGVGDVTFLEQDYSQPESMR